MNAPSAPLSTSAQLLRHTGACACSTVGMGCQGVHRAEQMAHCELSRTHLQAVKRLVQQLRQVLLETGHRRVDEGQGRAQLLVQVAE